MQKVAAYLLERPKQADTISQRKTEVARLIGVLQTWLQQKGAKELTAESGTFDSRDEKATYRWERAITQQHSWQFLRLDETSSNGRRFTTCVSITDTGKIVAVYATLEAGLIYSTIAPLTIQPKCPRFLRQILDLEGDWFHGPTKFQRTTRLTGEESGQMIANDILTSERTLPIILISEDYGEILIPKLDEYLAYDLAGLANVFVLDHDAAWGVTNILGKPWSCYWGAVRLYWPGVDLTQSPYHHPLWTADKLLANSESLSRTGDLFREQLKRLLMQVSALSVLRPREIDEIRNAVAKQQLTELQQNATSLEEFRKLAEEYAADNDRLRIQNELLDDELANAGALLQNAQELTRLQPLSNLTLDPELEPQKIAERPQKNTIRFYKKTGNNGRYDIMESVVDCGHKKWQSANSADQAKKGIRHYEGFGDWKNFWHCGKCDGGGVWKVKW